MSNDIYHDLVIHAPKEIVFRTISDPQHLINWWPLKCSGIPEVGQSYNFYFNPDYDWYGEVLRCDPFTLFYIKMTNADADWNPTIFGFDLVGDKGSTLVSFSHKNWPACNAHFRRSSYCWAILLQGLKNYIEKGVIVPFEDRE